MALTGLLPVRPLARPFHPFSHPATSSNHHPLVTASGLPPPNNQFVACRASAGGYLKGGAPAAVASGGYVFVLDVWFDVAGATLKAATGSEVVRSPVTHISHGAGQVASLQWIDEKHVAVLRTQEVHTQLSVVDTLTGEEVWVADEAGQLAKDKAAPELLCLHRHAGSAVPSLSLVVCASAIVEYKLNWLEALRTNQKPQTVGNPVEHDPSPLDRTGLRYLRAKGDAHVLLASGAKGLYLLDLSGATPVVWRDFSSVPGGPAAVDVRVAREPSPNGVKFTVRAVNASIDLATVKEDEAPRAGESPTETAASRFDRLAVGARPEDFIPHALGKLERDWREGVAKSDGVCEDANVLAASVDLWNWTGVQLRNELRKEYPDARVTTRLEDSRFRADALSKAVRLHLWWHGNVPSGPNDATFADHAGLFTKTAAARVSALDALEQSKQGRTWLFFRSTIQEQRGAVRDEGHKLALLYSHMGSSAAMFEPDPKRVLGSIAPPGELSEDGLSFALCRFLYMVCDVIFNTHGGAPDVDRALNSVEELTSSFAATVGLSHAMRSSVLAVWLLDCSAAQVEPATRRLMQERALELLLAPAMEVLPALRTDVAYRLLLADNAPGALRFLRALEPEPTLPLAMALLECQRWQPAFELCDGASAMQRAQLLELCFWR